MSETVNFPLSGDGQTHQIPADMATGAIPAESSTSQTSTSQSQNDEQSSATIVQPSLNAPDSANAQATPGGPVAAAGAKAAAAIPGNERRRRRRALISAPVRVRGTCITDENCPDEISVTLDVSRIGLLFLTNDNSYRRGMEVLVTFPYSTAPTAIHAEQSGRVARVVEMADGRRAVALALGKVAEEGVGEDLVDSGGQTLVKAPELAVKVVEVPGPKKPLVLAVDADETLRDSLKAYLMNEGYEVIAVSNCADAREVLNIYVPELIIAEVEGEGLPGFDLCAYVKGDHRLRKIPVVLTTRSGYPSDYSNAHSLGAVVCMAKPYKQERLGHVVRLLAPTPQAKLQPGPAPRPMPSCSSAPASAKPNANDSSKRTWRFRL
jgi:twitching motility two-component system response regulator PilG